MMPTERFARWMKANLFATPSMSVVSIILLSLGTKIFSWVFDWMIVRGVGSGGANACRESAGFCWAFIFEKAPFIFFGPYPSEERWRPFAVIILLSILIYFSTKPFFWGKKLLIAWPVALFVSLFLMNGGLFGLSAQTTEVWGGLPLTMLLAAGAFALAYPLGVLLALGRRAERPLITWPCIAFIELIRGVPLISLLFMGSLMLPLFLPQGVEVNKLVRALVAMALFTAAYLAEVVRGGLAAVPRGQEEAAKALGLPAWRRIVAILLPQALTKVIPPTINVALGLFKDTSLVMIIALFDLMMASKAALKDPDWLGFSVEAYVFTGLIYFVYCTALARAGRKLETHLLRN
jgi:general L-amino acid transport system permease protein